jgi:hypothetical protein
MNTHQFIAALSPWKNRNVFNVSKFSSDGVALHQKRNLHNNSVSYHLWNDFTAVELEELKVAEAKLSLSNHMAYTRYLRLNSLN